MRKLTFVCLLPVLWACERAPAPAPASAPAPAPAQISAVTEYTAILASVEASRRDIRDLADEVEALKETVAALQIPAAAPAAAAPAPAPAAPLVREIQLNGRETGLGADTAEFAIVEFTDYECPFCGRFNQQTLPRLKSAYIDTGKLKLITRDFPLDFHANADDAAIAANCAGEQNAYEAMRAEIFANSRALGPDVYERAATASGLDMGRFQACLADPQQAARVREDAALGASLGVTGTPSFFVGRLDGGKLVDVTPLVGALPFESFSAVIDPLLR